MAEALEEALAVLPGYVPELELAPCADTLTKPRFRLRVILSWASVPLLTLAAFAFSVALSWHATDVALLGGAYGTTGSFTLFAAFTRF
jgi:hypothetical protein